MDRVTLPDSMRTGNNPVVRGRCRVMKPAATRHPFVTPAWETAGTENLPFDNRCFAHDRADGSALSTVGEALRPMRVTIGNLADRCLPRTTSSAPVVTVSSAFADYRGCGAGPAEPTELGNGNKVR